MGGVFDGLPITARTCFDYRQAVPQRSIVERMNINEVTELGVCPVRDDLVLMNVGRRHLIVYSADDDVAVAADVAALRRWYQSTSSCHDIRHSLSPLSIALYTTSSSNDNTFLLLFYFILFYFSCYRHTLLVSLYIMITNMCMCVCHI